MNDEIVEDNDLLRINQAAELMGVSERTLRNWSEEGILPALVTSGGHRRYSKDCITKFKASIDPILIEEAKIRATRQKKARALPSGQYSRKFSVDELVALHSIGVFTREEIRDYLLGNKTVRDIANCVEGV